MKGHRSIRRHDGCPQVRASDGCRAPQRSRTRGFSLIELMVAMTILGLGLVLVATMFPVAWTRARDLAEYTTQEDITDSAEVILKQITRVDDPEDLAVTGGSFAGDIIYYPPATNGTAFYVEANPRVHALYLENLTAGTSSAPQRRFVPNHEDASEDNDFAPWLLEVMDDTRQLGMPGIKPAFMPPGFYDKAFGTSQIKFEQRVYPTLPRRDFSAVDNEGKLTGNDETWENALDQGRYAWAIFHRLRRDPMSNEEWNTYFTDASKYLALAREPRQFDIYYVTLRRTRPTLRYAVQNRAFAPNPFADDITATERRGVAVQVNALDPEFDVVLPVPWRVQVWFPDDVAPAANPTGVPTEIEVNSDDADTNTPFLIDFFDVGTPFIDEANGKIYHVTRRRIIGDNADQALITLDQEVVLEDIDDGILYDAPADNRFDNGIVEDPDERRRTVWVFPPSIERDGAGNPVFSGRQPVVGIDVRSLEVDP